MNWLSHVKSWLEVRRFLYVLVPVLTGVWVGFNHTYSKKLEDNTRDVKIEQSIILLTDEVYSMRETYEEAAIELQEHVIASNARIKEIEEKINSNHKSFIFSIEHQGEITRDAMLDMIYRLSNLQKKTSKQPYPQIPYQPTVQLSCGLEEQDMAETPNSYHSIQ